MRKRKSTRAPTFGFYGGIAGAAFGLLVPAALGLEAYAALYQLVFGVLGFVLGMGVGLLLARWTGPHSGAGHR